jgi:spore coat polysaccharide biosynthesis protein SpsF
MRMNNRAPIKTIGVIQARMNSTRYPGKVMDEICGKPLLEHVVERLQCSPSVDDIVIATTFKAEDREIVDAAEQYDVYSFAGSEHDVLKRFVDVAEFFQADYIVRIPADKPMFEPIYVDCCIERMLATDADYCYVYRDVTGTGVDVMKTEAMIKQAEITQMPHHREHVVPGMLENPEHFKIINIPAPDHLRCPGLRLTIDTPKDMELIRSIYGELYREGSIVDLGEAIRLVQANPGLMEINSEVVQNKATSFDVRALGGRQN